MSNSTTERSFSYQNVSVPQVNDTFYDLTTVSKIFNDSSTDLYNTSKTSTVESSSLFDNVKWEGYVEKDIPQNNYEYYDADGLSYGDESNLTQVKNVTNILINKQDENDSTSNYEENTTILILEPKENIGFEVEENITLVIEDNQENLNNTCNNVDVKIIKCFARVCNYNNNFEETKYKTTKGNKIHFLCVFFFNDINFN